MCSISYTYTRIILGGRGGEGRGGEWINSTVCDSENLVEAILYKFFEASYVWVLTITQYQINLDADATAGLTKWKN